LNKIANPSKARKTNVGSAPASVRFTNPNTAISDPEPCPEPDVAAAPLSSSPPKTASHPLSKIAHMVTKGIQVGSMSVKCTMMLEFGFLFFFGCPLQ
jgi:hypothetical protein